MTTGFAIQTVIEIIAVLFGVYALMHEDKFVAFENKVIKAIKKKIYLHKRRKAMQRRPQQGKTFVPPVLPKGEPLSEPKARARQNVA